MQVVITHGEAETIALGRSFAEELEPGAVVALFGDLGAGKTRFVQGICEGLGITGHVASPTFTIVHEYAAGTLAVFHFDWYRIRSIDELIDLGFDEYLRSDAICMIEWAEKAEALLPYQRFDVAIRLGATPDEREVTITEHGRTAA
jgi:tRNA threonylcarbamoyladenosine biosynthesis protein TsaE